MNTTVIEMPEQLRLLEGEIIRIKSAMADIDRRREEILTDRGRSRNIEAEADRLLQSSPLAEIEGREAELQGLRNNYSLLRQALELKQRQFDEERSRLHRAIVSEQFKPRHKEIVRRLVLAVIDVALVNEIEYQFREQVKDRKLTAVDATLRPMTVISTGFLHDSSSPARLFISECVEFGFITQRDIDTEISKRRKELQK